MLNSKVKSQKVLHKVRKRWVVISLALVMALGGTIIAGSTAHADSNSNQESVSSILPNSSRSLGSVNGSQVSGGNDHQSARVDPEANHSVINVKDTVNHINNDDWYRQHSTALHRLVNADLTPQAMAKIYNQRHSTEFVNLLNDTTEISPRLASVLKYDKSMSSNSFGNLKTVELQSAFKRLGLKDVSETPQYGNLLTNVRTIVNNRKDPEQISALKSFSNDLKSPLVSQVLHHIKDNFTEPADKEGLDIGVKSLINQISTENNDQINSSADQIVSRVKSQIQAIVNPEVNYSPKLVASSGINSLWSQLPNVVNYVSDPNGDLNGDPAKGSAFNNLIADLQTLPNNSNLAEHINNVKNNVNLIPGASNHFSQIIDSWQAANPKNSWSDLARQLSASGPSHSDAYDAAVLLNDVGQNNSNGASSIYQSLLNDFLNVHRDAKSNPKHLSNDAQQLSGDLNALSGFVKRRNPQIDSSVLDAAVDTIKNNFKPHTKIVDYVDGNRLVGNQTFTDVPNTVETLTIPSGYHRLDRNQIAIGQADQTIRVRVAKNSVAPSRPQKSYTETVNYVNHGKRLQTQTFTGAPGTVEKLTLPAGYRTDGLNSTSIGDSNRVTNVEVTPNAHFHQDNQYHADVSRPVSNGTGTNHNASVNQNRMIFSNSGSVSGPAHQDVRKSQVNSYSAPSSNHTPVSTLTRELPVLTAVNKKTDKLTNQVSVRRPKLQTSDYIAFDKAVKLDRGPKKKSIRLLPNTYIYVIKHFEGRGGNHYLVNANDHRGYLTVNHMMTKHLIKHAVNRVKRLKVLKQTKLHSRPNFSSRNVVIKLRHRRILKVFKAAHDKRGSVRFKVKAGRRVGYVTAANNYVRNVTKKHSISGKITNSKLVRFLLDHGVIQLRP